MGSGTVGAVAIELGRKFIGFEINSDYCEIAQKGYKQNMMKKNAIILIAFLYIVINLFLSALVDNLACCPVAAFGQSNHCAPNIQILSVIFGAWD